MSVHNYTRDLVNGVYDINNPERIDSEGNHIDLYMEIAENEGFCHKFDIKCSQNECQVIFNFDLTDEQISELNTIVQNHKNNT